MLVTKQFRLLLYGQNSTDISQNIFFHVPQKYESHTGLEGHESETEFSFLSELCL